jgi:murein DD-endopeptidase MepM/ murein hydrolase activator NlpD
MIFRLSAAVLLAACLSFAQRITQSTLSLTASEDRCVAGKPVTELANTERQLFFRFLLSRGPSIQALTVEWLAPGGQMVEFENYDRLPAGASLCFLTQIPIAGFEAAQRPGEWTVRVASGARVLEQKKFLLKGDPNTARGLAVTSVTRQETGERETEITLTGAGFHGETFVHLATYSVSNSWQFLASMSPATVEPGRLTVKYGEKLSPGEYWVVAKNLDGAQSAPARLLVATDRGYALPFAAGEQWIITQGPYGGTSHWGRSLHAWDLAPLSLRTGGCVTAMRAGVVHAFDRGERQNVYSRSFGNYITIQHDDGEYSHYSHLRTGTFVVRSGQRVEAGQALAIVGNSGHTLGANGGYHVHAHVTREFRAASQSIPFTYASAPDARKGKVVMNPVPLTGSCGVQFEGPVSLQSQSKKPAGPQWQGRVGLSEWWTQTLNVPKGTRALEVLIAWARAESQKVDLYLVSPSGAQYGGPYADPRKMRIPSPEAGAWRISVQGVQSDGDAIDFEAQARLSPE